jgi:hypothetical protein
MKKLNLIIAGGRDFNDYPTLENAMKVVNSMHPDTEITIISGCARGADHLGLLYATQYGLAAIRMPADWDQQGKRAGFIRNATMAREADALLAFWDGESKGTYHMISCMNDLQKQTILVRY